MKIIAVIPEEFGVVGELATGIAAKFQGKVEEALALAPEYQDIMARREAEGDTPELVEAARVCRKKLAKIRTSVGKIHKTEKSYYLGVSRYIDAFKNAPTEALMQAEADLKAIEEAAERAERERLELIAHDRRVQLARYGAAEPIRLAEMAEEEFVAILERAKLAHEAEELRRKEEAEEKERLHQSLAQAQAEQKAAQEALATAQAQEALRKESETRQAAKLTSGADKERMTAMLNEMRRVLGGAVFESALYLTAQSRLKEVLCNANNWNSQQ